jgi:hypothetical protein
MKRNNTSKEEIEEKLPFSFKKKAISMEKINGHWQRIAEKIAAGTDSPALDAGKKKVP